MSISIYSNPGYSYDSGYSNTPTSMPGQLDEKSLEMNLEQLEALFSADTGKGVNLPEGMKELLGKIAEFMDKHPEIFGKPEGKDSWQSELEEDDKLNGKESKQFGNAIDMLRDALGGASGQQGADAPDASKFDNALIPSGNGESTLNPSKKNELEDVAKFMDQHPELFGKPEGKDTWLSELKENNHLDKGETKNFEKAIDLLKDAQGITQGGTPGGQDASAPITPQQPPVSAQNPEQQGDSAQDLKDLLIPNGKGESYLNPSKKDQLEDVAKLMDQHPDIFGKPEGKDSWLSELKEDNFLNNNETKQFNKAIDLMKDAGAGQSPARTESTPTQSTPEQPASGQSAPGEVGGNDLKDALVQTGKGDAYLNPSKEKDIEDIAKFMDQHPEVFGKPEGKDSWLSELKEDNYLNPAENKQFSKAIDMMQDARGANGAGETPQFESAGGEKPGKVGGSDTELRSGNGPSTYDDLINKAADKYGLDPNLIKAVIKQESNFDPNAVSPSGCQGLMQLNPNTAASLGGGDLNDPATNIDLGAKYLKQMLDMSGGDVRDALIKYNAGPYASGGGDNVPTGQDHSAGSYADKILASLG